MKPVEIYKKQVAVVDKAGIVQCETLNLAMTNLFPLDEVGFKIAVGKCYQSVGTNQLVQVFTARIVGHEQTLVRYPANFFSLLKSYLPDWIKRRVSIQYKTIISRDLYPYLKVPAGRYVLQLFEESI